VQQNGSCWQIFATQGAQSFLSGPPVLQGEWVHGAQGPQSAGQVSQVSLLAQTPFPQVTAPPAPAAPAPP
jgi:hypothetical protein